MTNHLSLNLHSKNLTQIQTAKDNSAVDKDLYKVADQFEAIFIENLLKQNNLLEKQIMQKTLK